MTKADVAILIVSYNSEQQIGACLQSVLAERRRVVQQVIVLDNDSRDSTVNLIREQFPQVELLTPGRNLGFAAGVNFAARHAKADYLLLLNPDTVLLDNAIDVIVDFARANPGHGLYGGRTLKPDGSLEPSSCWGLPSLWSLLLFATGLTTAAPKNRWLDPESLGGWKRDTVKEVGVITGCFLLAEHAAWEKLGGFDERYFMYGEDVDLAMRAHAAHYRPLICPDARLIHEVGQSSAKPLDKLMLLYRGKAHYIRQNWNAFVGRCGVLLLVAGVALRAGLSLYPRLARRSVGTPWRALYERRGEWRQGYS